MDADDEIVRPLQDRPVRVDRPRQASAVLRHLRTDAPESSSTLTPSVATAADWTTQYPGLSPILLIATDGQLSDFDNATQGSDARLGEV